MSENATANCGLPLLMPAQAQKHVTVNDALLRVDGQLDLVLQSTRRTIPPAVVIDGQCWAVPVGAVNAWEGHEGQIAIGANGGWIFVAATYGRRAVIADQGVTAIHDGRGWVPGALNMGAHGSGLIAMQASEDVVLASGNTVASTMVLPTGAMVIGVTGRVLEPITCGLTSWSAGTTGALNRFGQGLGKVKDTWSRGILSQPMTYWDPAPILITATGGNFTGGKIRLVAHWLELRIPM